MSDEQLPDSSLPIPRKPFGYREDHTYSTDDYPPLSTTMRVWLTFDGSSVAPKELGALSIPDPVVAPGIRRTIQTSPFSGARIPREDIVTLLRTIADDLEEGRSRT